MSCCNIMMLCCHAVYANLLPIHASAPGQVGKASAGQAWLPCTHPQSPRFNRNVVFALLRPCSLGCRLLSDGSLPLLTPHSSLLTHYSLLPTPCLLCLPRTQIIHSLTSGLTSGKKEKSVLLHFRIHTVLATQFNQCLLDRKKTILLLFCVNTHLCDLCNPIKNRAYPRTAAAAAFHVCGDFIKVPNGVEWTTLVEDKSSEIAKLRQMDIFPQGKKYFKIFRFLKYRCFFFLQIFEEKKSDFYYFSIFLIIVQYFSCFFLEFLWGFFFYLVGFFVGFLRFWDLKKKISLVFFGEF